MGVGALKRNESWLGDFYCPKKHFMRFLVGFISALNSLGSELLTSSCVIDLQPPFFWEGVSNCPLAFFALCRLVVRPCNKLNCQTNGPNLLRLMLFIEGICCWLTSLSCGLGHDLAFCHIFNPICHSSSCLVLLEQRSRVLPLCITKSL